MATCAETDPRIKLYFEAVTYIQLLRYEFISWTPLPQQTSAYKDKLSMLQCEIPNIYSIPSIKKLSNRCYKCSKALKNDESLFEICTRCEEFIGKLLEFYRGFPSPIEKRFEKILSDKEISLVTCFRCRKIGHICEM
ncbi:hypothetical protein SteCoe_3708 [Stentor coeruleus]|uniref:Uncharacterized protein n=1 Tax=Stentor coeruleus TaxID=5963 RepID=A0A1R2CWJ8_9CILI|nr:hypothetical protein SteCoe_3708 [Stentor coeruleus]